MANIRTAANMENIVPSAANTVVSEAEIIAAAIVGLEVTAEAVIVAPEVIVPAAASKNL